MYSILNYANETKYQIDSSMNLSTQFRFPQGIAASIPKYNIFHSLTLWIERQEFSTMEKSNSKHVYEYAEQFTQSRVLVTNVQRNLLTLHEFHSKFLRL